MRLAIVDISNLIYRAYYAVPELTAPNGQHVNAVFGVTNMLLSLIQNQKPTHILIAKDGPKSFRSDISVDYKANRSETPDNLKPQFELIDKLLDSFGMKHVVIPGFEADDIIGSAAKTFSTSVDNVLIVSGDKDLMQLVNSNTFILDTMKNKLYGVNDVVERYKVMPNQIADYLALVGDKSDNIPGVTGIGDKGAVQLLQRYGTLTSCLDNAETIETARLKKAILNGKEDAILSKSLTLINTDIQLPLLLDDLKYNLKDNNNLLDFFLSLGFKSCISQVISLFNTTI